MTKHLVKFILYSSLFLLSALLLFTIFVHRHYREYQTTLMPGFFLQDAEGDLRSSSWSVPVVYDWNGDGAKDLLAGKSYKDEKGIFHGAVDLYINTASDSSPVFGSAVLLQTCADSCSPVSVSAFG